MARFNYQSLKELCVTTLETRGICGDLVGVLKRLKGFEDVIFLEVRK